MATARFALPHTPDIGTWKLCGNGHGRGVHPASPTPPSGRFLATWPDPETARERVASAPVWKRWRAKHAEESWTVFLTPTSARGKWAGVEPPSSPATSPPGPAFAALTRATVKRAGGAALLGPGARHLDRDRRRHRTSLFKIGIGEVPLLHQVTFSIWPSEKAMAAFARTGPHGDVIKAVREEGWFKEELYARFAVHSDMGTCGRHLAAQETGSCMKYPFPFAAIVGQEEMKRAMILTAIDPGIGGVLVFGDRGTGKSTAVRALAALLPPITAVKGCPINAETPGEVPAWAELAEKVTHEIPTPVVDLPLGVSDDRVTGALDIERALTRGEKAFQPGLLGAGQPGVSVYRRGEPARGPHR